jgi:hypothetical protein
MAWTERPTATLTFICIDETGSKANFSLDVPQATLMDAAMTAAGVLRPLIEAITDCAVLSYSLVYSAFDDAPPAAATDSRVERKGVFQFLTAAGKKVTYQVPGIKDSGVLQTGRIDDDNIEIKAFTTALTALDAIFCDSNGVDLRTLVGAYERYRSTTRGWTPRNRAPDADILPGGA